MQQHMESRKMVLRNLTAGQQWRCRHREQTYGRGRQKGGMTEELRLGLCDNLEGWNWVGDGREVQAGGDIRITYG